jgi:hypothetical protein
LKAVNVGRSAKTKRPRWRITQAALDAFEASRTPTATVETSGKARRKKPTDVREFYK